MKIYIPGGTYRDATPDEVAAFESRRAPRQVASLPIFEISKLKLRRNLRAAGVEAQYDLFIAALPPTVKADFDDSTVLKSDDPDLVAALPQFAAILGKTEDELKAILRASRA